MNQPDNLNLLPLNISSFNKIYDYNMIYVDKTPLIHSLICRPGQYFLSRPRRFGKSLLVSLLKHLFLGNKEYFKLTWIAQNVAWQFKFHPVLIFDFNGISHDNPEQLTRMLAHAMNRQAAHYELEPLTETEPKEKLIELILTLHKTFHEKVIVLVDEYDKPIIDHLGINEKRLDIATANRDVLKSFFSTFKDNLVAEQVEFLFITGVSKFSHVSIFSDLNNLTDLTMDDRFATILGYTEFELKQYFHSWIEKWAKDKSITENSIYQTLKDLYDGFRFSSAIDKVYNPISILSALDQQKYKNYWFETATPTFLINLLDQNHFSIPKIETSVLQEKHFSSYELTNLDPTALMFQTGYITIKDVKRHDRITEFVFDFPNVEVKQSFLELIIIKYGQLSKDDYATDSLKLYHDLMHHRFGFAIQTIQDVFQRIPKLDHQSQQWFLQMFYMMIQSACPHTRTITTLGDKMIIMIESNQSTIFIAFSCSHAVKDLILELNVNPIIHPFKLSDKDLYFVGISFDHQKREITDWTDEHVNPKPVEIPASQKAFVKIIKLFLASSGDLENERKEISLWINRKNKRFIKNNTFIELVIWEDLLHSFQGERIQDYFNQEMLACDIVVALFYSKVGQFTKEEFDLAYSSLKAGQKPYYLFVGFKNAQISTRDITKNYFEVIELRETIKQNEQLYITFESIDQLILQLDAQIETCIHQLTDK
jgi:hypothetical protein